MDIVPLLGAKGKHGGRHIHLTTNTGELVERKNKLSTLSLLRRLIENSRSLTGLLSCHKSFNYFKLFEQKWLQVDIAKLAPTLSEFNKLSALHYAIDKTYDQINSVRFHKKLFGHIKAQLKKVKEIIDLSKNNLPSFSKSLVSRINIEFGYVSLLIYELNQIIQHFSENSFLPGSQMDAQAIFLLAARLQTANKHLMEILNKPVTPWITAKHSPNTDAADALALAQPHIYETDNQAEQDLIMQQLSEYERKTIEFSSLISNKKYNQAIDFYEEKLASETKTGDYINNLIQLIYCHIELSNFTQAISYLTVSFFFSFSFLIFIHFPIFFLPL